jgi:hypothetical protein
MRSLLNVVLATGLAAFAPAIARADVGANATIIGTVTLTDADGGTWAGDGVRVALACGAGRTTRTEVADAHGAFRFLNVPAGSCSVEAGVQGFLAQTAAVVVAARQVVEIGLRLGVAPMGVGVNVGGTAPPPKSKMRPGSSSPDTSSPDLRDGVCHKSASPGWNQFGKRAASYVTTND